MPSLLTLPKELLLDILSHLPLPVIENVAKTYNYHLTATCLTLLHPLFARRRHIEALKSRYGEFVGVETYEFEIFIQETAKFGISKEEWRRVREPTEEDVLERMEWLELTFKDDLKWLQPVSQTKAETEDSNGVQPLLTDAQILKLQDEAQEASVQIPDSFFQLARSQDLLLCLPGDIASSFQIKTGLERFARFDNEDTKVYILPFYLDPDGTETYLCLDNSGRHFVLANTGLYIAEWESYEYDLLAASFVEWLAVKVFEQEIEDVIMEGRVVDDALRDYVKAMYVRRPEEIESGKPTRMERRAVITIGGTVIKKAFE